MRLSDAVLGTHVTTKLRERAGAELVRIGRDRFGRRELAHIECFNFTAAANLSRVLEALAVADTRALFETVSPKTIATIPRLGSISLAVLGACFEIKKIGGASPLDAWVKKHEKTVVTYASLKHREHLEAQAERRETKRRKSTRRDQAHRARVDRFTERQGEATI